MNKTFKYRLYPNKKQIEQINKTFGCVRFIYNYYLEKSVTDYKREGTKFSKYKFSKELTNLKKELLWLNEVDARALLSALDDLEHSLQYFFRGNAKFPKFRKKCCKGSYRTKWTNNNIQYCGRYIKIPKLGFVKTRNKLPLNGRILNATIKRTSSGKYYALICCECDEVTEINNTSKIIGIDLGIKHFAILSSGEKIDNPRFFSEREKKIVAEHRKLCKKKIGSKNYRKQQIKLAKQYEKITNQKMDFLHKTTTKIINENQIVCLESLNIKGMKMNKKISKAINDVSWGYFTKQLTYKAKKRGCEIVYIDRWFPSSQMCSICGYVNPQLKKLDVRKWKCPQCGTEHDRDINAAVNIAKQGINKISNKSVG